MLSPAHPLHHGPRRCALTWALVRLPYVPLALLLLCLLSLLCDCGGSASTPGSNTEASADGETTTDGGAAFDGPATPEAMADSASSFDAAPDASQDASPDAPTDAIEDAVIPTDAGASSCSVASGCRAYSSYCGACRCLALPANAPTPACDAGIVSCFVDPCGGRSATCTPAGICAVQ